jgi:hypothetical protein
MITTVFILVGAVSLIQFVDAKLLTAASVLIIAIVNMPTILEMLSSTKQTKKDIKQNEISEDMYYNSHIHDLLLKLRPFKKYNKVTYKDGVKYMRKFFKTVKILEHDSLTNRNQYFDMASDYLTQAVNHFQSISVSMPERTLKDALKYGDYTPTSKTKELSIILKELYQECHYILLNIGITYNEEWSKHPNIYTHEIDLNTDRVKSYNSASDNKWSVF